MKAHPELKATLYKTLKYSCEPLKRGTLIYYLGARLPAIRWSQATWARRIREAIDDLISDGVPVVSDGTGFRIAAHVEELEAGLRKKERMALTLLRQVSRARRIPLGHLAKQLGLFEGVA